MLATGGFSLWQQYESNAVSDSSHTSRYIVLVDSNRVYSYTNLTQLQILDQVRVGNEPSHEPVLAREMARRYLVTYISYF